MNFLSIVLLDSVNKYFCFLDRRMKTPFWRSGISKRQTSLKFRVLIIYENEEPNFCAPEAKKVC